MTSERPKRGKPLRFVIPVYHTISFLSSPGAISPALVLSYRGVTRTYHQEPNRSLATLGVDDRIRSGPERFTDSRAYYYTTSTMAGLPGFEPRKRVLEALVITISL